jgi:hypothetical protein
MNRLIAVAVLLASPLTARAQVNFGALEDNAQLASVSTGSEHGLVLGVGYASVVPVADRPLLLGANATLQWGDVDLSDFKLRAGALVPIVRHGQWTVAGGLAAVVRGTSNDAARLTNVGADTVILAGYYRRGWFAAGEIGFDWALATRIDHSDAYRMQVFSDARDGWYRMTGGTFRYGLQGGASFAANDVVLRLGWLRDLAGDPLLFPLYGTVTYDRRW